MPWLGQIEVAELIIVSFLQAVSLIVKQDDKFITNRMIINPVKAMKLLNNDWKHKDYVCKAPLVEGEEKFANTGDGNMYEGFRAPAHDMTMEFIMEEGISRGHAAFQLFFGNKGWQPTAAFAKKEFKKVCRRCNTELSFVQQAGDQVCCENAFQRDRKSAHLSKEEIATWTQDWHMKKIRQTRHASTEQQECVGTHELPQFLCEMTTWSK